MFYPEPVNLATNIIMVSRRPHHNKIEPYEWKCQLFYLLLISYGV